MERGRVEGGDEPEGPYKLVQYEVREGEWRGGRGEGGVESGEWRGGR